MDTTTTATRNTTATPALGADARQRIRARLASLYGEPPADAVMARLEEVVRGHIAGRAPAPPASRWSERDAVVITYGDSIQFPGEQPLETLRQFLDTRLGDVVSCVHLLPFYPYSSDDGFSVIDYRAVDPELGNWEHVAAIGDTFDLMFDLVLNHVSRESLWFADFVERMPPGRDFFVEADPADNLALVVRPRPSPVLVEVRTRHDIRHVWATFSNDQIDLNYRNPDVLLAMLEILLFYVRRGARILRLDAVAFLWKEIGTSCIHLPQTHGIVKLFRDVLDAVEPGTLLLTETNVPHAENITYFGDGDEAHAVYQFSLPPLLLHALHSGSTRALNTWAAQLAPPPRGCTFFNFTASHDGIGLRPLEGLVPPGEIDELLEAMRSRGAFVSTRLDTLGREIPYELNVTWFDAVGGDGGARAQVARFLLTQTVALSLQGIPGIYIHSLLATHNDIAGLERTGRIRSINRRRWDLRELEQLLADPASDHARVFGEYCRRLRIRRAEPAFHPDVSQQVIDLGDDLFCVARGEPGDGIAIVCVFNFTPRPVRVAAARLELPPLAAVTDLLDENPLTLAGEDYLLGPYAARWLKRLE